MCPHILSPEVLNSISFEDGAAFDLAAEDTFDTSGANLDKSEFGNMMCRKTKILIETASNGCFPSC